MTAGAAAGSVASSRTAVVACDGMRDERRASEENREADPARASETTHIKMNKKNLFHHLTLIEAPTLFPEEAFSMVSGKMERGSTLPGSTINTGKGNILYM